MLRPLTVARNCRAYSKQLPHVAASLVTAWKVVEEQYPEMAKEMKVQAGKFHLGNTGFSKVSLGYRGALSFVPFRTCNCLLVNCLSSHNRPSPLDDCALHASVTTTPPSRTRTSTLESTSSDQPSASTVPTR